MTAPAHRLEVRNIRATEIAGVLVNEYGGVAHGDVIDGDGWQARLVAGEPARVGRMRVPVLFIEVRGPRADDAARFLRLKTMRGGG